MGLRLGQIRLQVLDVADDRLYFFHLGCNVWVSERVLEHAPHGRRYPKNYGLFGHSASVRKKNTLLISGGYHGSVNSDVLAYIFPYALAMTDNDKVPKKDDTSPL